MKKTSRISFGNLNNHSRNKINKIDIFEWEKHKSLNKVMHIKAFKDINISWDKVISLANESLLDQGDIYTAIRKIQQRGYETSKYVYENDLASIVGTIGYMQFVSKLPSQAKEIDEAVDDIDKMLNLDIKRNSVQLFCNVVSTSYVSEIHSDPWDSAVFQVKGETVWDMFTEDRKDILQSVVLEEGDLLLVPRKALHRVTSRSSRVTLNFTIPGSSSQQLTEKGNE